MKRMYQSANLITALFFWGFVQDMPVFAQMVAPDTSLGTVVNSVNGRDYAITQGTQSGSNLFHSFRSFSIPNQGSATFDLTGKVGISSIFSRVTGTDFSNIDGVIQTLGGKSPNLFLMNPNGIVFGPGARLNAIGAFVGTTATGIQFKEATFAADVNQPLPLLSVNVPIGLQMGSTSGNLTVNGTGNDAIFPTNNFGLMGTPGSTIALLGRNINLNSGVVTAPAGRLDVGAVETGTVGIQTTPIGFALTYGTELAFGDVNLAARSSLWNPDSVGNPFGGIQVVGNNITIDQSQIAVGNLSSQRGADLTVKSAGTLTLKGVDPFGVTPTWITNQVLPGATGAGGTIRVQAGNIQILDGAAIEAFNFGPQAGGNVEVSATDSIVLRDFISTASPYRNGMSRSTIGSTTDYSGTGAVVSVTARSVDMRQGGAIVTVVGPTAKGRGGDIRVQADRINSQDVMPLLFGASSSGIQALTIGDGRSGDVNVQVRNLRIFEGGIVSSLAYRLPGLPNSGMGDAGTVNIQADTIEILGASVNTGRSAFLGSATTGSGQAGDVNVAARSIVLRDGGSLTSGTAAVFSVFGDPSQANRLGNGGTIRVRAETLDVDGRNPYVDNPSSIGTYTVGNGDAGNAFIEADRIAIQNGGELLSSTAASGNAGSLEVRAREILVTGRNRDGSASSIASSGEALDVTAQMAYGAPAIPTGNTGILKIIADRLTLQDGGQISVKHEGVGNAGDLKINVNSLGLNQEAEIVGSTLTGMGGNVAINVRDVLLLRDRSNISVSSAGIGNGGNIKLNAGLIVGINNSDIIANANQGNGGNIQLTTEALIGISPQRQLTPDSDITASSGLGLDGTIAVQTLTLTPQTALPILNTAFTDAQQQVKNACATANQNQFISTGRGGIPQSPIKSLATKRSWQDLRSAPLMTAQVQPIAHPTSPLPTDVTRSSIVEATAWAIGPNNQVELITASVASLPIAATCAESGNWHF
jgi:filamentous hemagglutinin family protein